MIYKIDVYKKDILYLCDYFSFSLLRIINRPKNRIDIIRRTLVFAHQK